jgi:hypothetical protein
LIKIFLVYKSGQRRRQRTCQDFICLFEGICQIINRRPHCTCHHVTCTSDEQRLMDICASDGRTYKSKCAIKRQRCLKQYEIGLIYPGVCAGKKRYWFFCSLYGQLQMVYRKNILSWMKKFYHKKKRIYLIIHHNYYRLIQVGRNFIYL